MKNVIRKAGMLPARKLDDDRLSEVKGKGFRIKFGPGARWFDPKDPNKSLCIMEAASYILGHNRGGGDGSLNDSPPCTSARIRGFMIGLNDSESITDEQRAQLIDVIPDIVNTAPTKYHPEDATFLVTDRNDPDYREAEGKRLRMRYDFMAAHDASEIGDLWETTTIDEILAFVREMADVARFDGTNGDEVTS